MGIGVDGSVGTGDGAGDGKAGVFETLVYLYLDGRIQPMNPENKEIWNHEKLKPEINSDEPEDVFLHIPLHPKSLSDFLERLSDVIGKPITSVDEVLEMAIEAGFELTELQEEDMIQLRRQRK